MAKPKAKRRTRDKRPAREKHQQESQKTTGEKQTEASSQPRLVSIDDSNDSQSGSILQRCAFALAALYGIVGAAYFSIQFYDWIRVGWEVGDGVLVFIALVALVLTFFLATVFVGGTGGLLRKAWANHVLIGAYSLVFATCVAIWSIEFLGQSNYFLNAMRLLLVRDLDVNPSLIWPALAVSAALLFGLASLVMRISEGKKLETTT